LSELFATDSFADFRQRCALSRPST
jgi:hypothetical protein